MGEMMSSFTANRIKEFWMAQPGEHAAKKAVSLFHERMSMLEKEIQFLREILLDIKAHTIYIQNEKWGNYIREVAEEGLAFSAIPSNPTPK